MRAFLRCSGASSACRGSCQVKAETLLLAGAAVIAYTLLKPKGETPAYLAGVSANKILADAQASLAVDPTALDTQLSALSAQSQRLTASLKANPSLGIALGLTPTQIDYTVLPPDQFRTIYGFSQPAEPVTPAAPVA